MEHKKWLGLALGSTLLMLSMATHAQKMYRCGSVYQDRPCDTAQGGKEVRNFDNAPKATAVAGVDAQCRQRGIDSQKIVWAREAGALAEKQMAGASPDERSLIADVYARRGSAPEVRASIETDCVAAKKQAELAAAMLAGLKVQGKEPSSPGTAAATGQLSGSDARTVDAPRGNDTAARVADNKKAICANISAKIDVIQRALRGGGSIAAMEDLNQRRRDAEAERSRAGC